MNPFDLLNIKPAFFLDWGEVDQNYFARQKACHPDQFAHKSSVEQKVAQTKTMEINQAYKVLKNPLDRAKALIGLVGGTVLDQQSPVVLAQAFEWRTRQDDEDPTLLDDLISEQKRLEALFQKAFDEKNLPLLQETYGFLVYCLKALSDLKY